MPKLPDPPQNGQRLAVNLCDLDRVDSSIRGMLLSGKLNLQALIRMDRDRPDETAVAFSCDLLTAATCCDVLRGHDLRAGDYPTRVYLFRQSWSKLPGSTVLTLVNDGKVFLNPEVFAGSLAIKPLARQAVEL